MPSPPTCPSDQDLRLFLEGRGTDLGQETLAAHLEDCPDCVRRCRILSPQGSLVEVLQNRLSIEAADLSSNRSQDDSTAGDRRLLSTSPFVATPLLKRTDAARTTEPFPEVAGYEVLEYLARGGMGVVYKARDLRLGRIVALKCPRGDSLADVEFRERFLREARSAAKLSHPNICSIHEVREVAGSPVIVMGFVTGVSLREWNRVGVRPPRDIAVLMARVARAVHYAHEHGLVHRDLKPANVMFETETGQPILMDFGLAKDHSDTEGLTVSGQVLGTPAYMAPEQAAGRVGDVGPAADIYGLGAMLYDLLTGKPPFSGPMGEILLKVQRDDPVPVRRIRSEVSSDLATICAKAMEKRPGDRYATAAAFAEDLERFARGDFILARPIPAWRRVARGLRRHPLAAAAACVLLATTILFGVYAPRVGHRIRASQLQQRLEERLADDAWSAEDLAEADRFATELATYSGIDGGLVHRRVTQRWEASLLARLRSSALPPGFQKSFEEDLEALRRRDPDRAARLDVQLRERLGSWFRLADVSSEHPDWTTVFANPSTSSTNALRRPAKAGDDAPAEGYWGTEHSPGDIEFEARVRLGANDRITFLSHASRYVSGSVDACVFHPSGSYLATGSASGEVMLWPSGGEDEPKRLGRHLGRVADLAFSADGRWLASVGNAGEVIVWSTPEGREVARKRVEVPGDLRNSDDWALALRFVSQDGILTVGGGGLAGKANLHRWKTSNWAPLPPLTVAHGDLIIQIVGDGTADGIVLGTRSGAVERWDVASGQRRWGIEPTGVMVDALDVGLGRVAAHRGNGLIAVYSLEQGRQERVLDGHEANVRRLRFTPQGTLVAAYVNPAAIEWDPATGTVVGRLVLPESRTASLAVHPQERWIAIGAPSGRTIVWDRSTGGKRRIFGTTAYRFEIKGGKDGDCELRILHDTASLRQVRLTGGSKDGEWQIRCSRLGESLTIEANDQPPLKFLDVAAPRTGREGRWGVVLSENVELRDLVVRHRPLPLRESPQDAGDLHLSQGRFQEAAQEYERLLADSSGSEASLSQEDRANVKLKLAICELESNRTELAVPRLEDLAFTDTSPTAFFAAVQVWRFAIATQDWTRAAAIGRHCVSRFPITKYEPMFADHLRREIEQGLSNLAFRRRAMLSPGVVPRFREAEELLTYLEHEAESPERLARIRYLSARLVGDDSSAAKEAGQIVDFEAALARLESAESWRDFQSISWIDLRIASSNAERRTRLSRALAARRDPSPPPVGDAALAAAAGRARLVAAWLACDEEDFGASEVAARDAIQLLRNSKEAIDLGWRLRASLFLGSLLARHGREEEAAVAWRRAREDLAESHDSWRLAENMAPVLLTLAFSRGNDQAADSFDTSAVIRQVLDDLRGTVSLPDSLFDPRALTAGWTTPYGRRHAEAIVAGWTTLEEELMLLARVGGWGFLERGAFAEGVSEEQRRFLEEFVDRGFAWYVADEGALTGLATPAIAWKTGWRLPRHSLAIALLPRELQPDVAYLLGRRELQVRPKNGSAAAFFQLARELAPPGSLTRQLADETPASP